MFINIVLCALRQQQQQQKTKCIKQTNKQEKEQKSLQYKMVNGSQRHVFT